VGDGGTLGTTFSVMMPLSKASSKDSKVVDGCSLVDTAEPERVPGWAGWGVSSATGGSSCVVWMGAGCGGD